tara:strand:- start:5113 stop:5322 length:210 start_codon:yes stop_codon:yes gene_type:complete
MKTVNQQAKILQDEIKAKKLELSKLQDDCKHEKKQIKMDETNSAMWECENCSRRLRYPTPAEMDIWISK